MIEKYSFGRMVISGNTYSTDLKIINRQVIPEWWRKSGHTVDIHDLADILAARPEYLIIGTGIGGRMKVSKPVKMELKRLGIELIEEPNSSAVKTFNRLLDAGENIAAGFHLTY